MDRVVKRWILLMPSISSITMVHPSVSGLDQLQVDAGNEGSDEEGEDIGTDDSEWEEEEDEEGEDEEGEDVDTDEVVSMEWQGGGEDEDEELLELPLAEMMVGGESVRRRVQERVQGVEIDIENEIIRRIGTTASQIDVVAMRRKLREDVDNEATARKTQYYSQLWNVLGSGI